MSARANTTALATTARAVGLGLMLGFALALGACRGCSDATAAPLARLVALQGEAVSRDFAARQQAWEPAGLGAEFRLGDGLRTRAPSTALLGLVDGSKLQVQSDTTIRFLAGGEQGEQGIDVLTGEALLLAGARDVNLRMHVGRAVIGAGGRVRLTRSSDALDLRVEVGEARFRSAAGQDMRVSAGDDVRLKVGMAVLRAGADTDALANGTDVSPGAAGAGASAPDAAVEDEEADATSDHRMTGGGEPGPDYSNFGARAGESFVVHAPELPVAVSFEIGHKCKGEGVLEIAHGKQRARGNRTANLLFPAGARAYTLRCLDKSGAPSRVVARGTVNVLHDAGTRRLPARAPTSEVDADGRSYTIYYQNQLPDVRVRWPNPPSAASYLLDVDGKSMTLGAAEHVFRSGTLRDGVHRVTFEAKGRKSRTASVTVRFDNAAPTASLGAPLDRSFTPGATIAVEGVTLPGWKVSVPGGTIAKDQDDRFQGQVVTSAEHPDVVVRLSHARRGTHYYLRRARGSR